MGCDQRILFVLSIVLLCDFAVAAERPVAVSPGSDSGVAMVEARCPTFSWGLVEEARSYDLVVYRVGEEGADETPVLRQSLPGTVGGWTPALDRCLRRGARYAWSIRASGGDVAGEWSVARVFEVADSAIEAEVEAALRLLRDRAGESGATRRTSKDTGTERAAGWTVESVSSRPLTSPTLGASNQPAPTGLPPYAGIKSVFHLPYGYSGAGVVGLAIDYYDAGVSATGVWGSAGSEFGVGVRGEASGQYSSGGLFSNSNTSVSLARADGRALIASGSLGGDAVVANHVALIKNTLNAGSADVLALQIGEPGALEDANNFISFFNGDETLLGEIEGANLGGSGLVGLHIKAALLSLTPTDSPPACVAGLKGMLYFDTSVGRPCFCDGAFWRSSDLSVLC